MANKIYELEKLIQQEILDPWDYTERLHGSGLSELPPTMIACAITGAQQNKASLPALPVTPDEQARAAKEAYDAGAVMVHVHRRDPDNTSLAAQDPELFKEVNIKIREKCPDLIINNTCGGGAAVDVKTGIRGKYQDVSIGARPEVCSLDSSTYVSYVKLPPLPGIREKAEFFESMYTITQTEVLNTANRMLANGIKPEFECFLPSDYYYISRLLEEGYKDLNNGPIMVNMVFTGGSNWPTPSFVDATVRHCPRNSVLFLSATGAQQWAVLTQGVLQGTHVRCGIEDNFYLSRGKKASGNGELVEKLATIIRLLDRPIATCEQARKILRLSAPRVW